MKRTTILIADDHKMFAEGLASLLEEEFELVGIVENGKALIEAATRLEPEVIVVDISSLSLTALMQCVDSNNPAQPPK